jgi:drug/metabolite transporter (DMT)-like permease
LTTASARVSLVKLARASSIRVPRNLKADLLLTFCAVIWGATFVVVKDALANTSVFVFLALRFLVAASALGVVYRRELRGLGAGGYRAGAVIGCFMFSGYAFQTVGLRLTTPSKTAFITGFCVVLVPVFMALFGGRRIHGWVWAGALSALVGLYYLTVPSSVSSGWASVFSGLNGGDLLVLCCSVMFAMHIIAIGHYAPRYPAGALTLLQIAMTALLTSVTVPLLAVTRWEAARVAWTPRLVMAVLVTGVVATAMAFSAQVWAQQHTTPSHTAIIFTLEPVFAGITSFVFYHERLGRRSLAGAGLILVGILLAELRGPARAAPESVAAPRNAADADW